MSYMAKRYKMVSQDKLLLRRNTIACTRRGGLFSQ